MSLYKKIRNSLRALYEGATRFLFDTLPGFIGTMIAAFAIVAPIVFIGFAYVQGTKQAHPSSFTVMITNEDGTRGGSGSIIDTSPSESRILTNAHVCNGALQNGGKIRRVDGEEHRVTGYYLSDEHDLCLLTVAVDLKHKAPIAPRAPNLYDEALITGHPALMPNIMSKGHFGGRQIIQLLTGLRKCNANDFQDPVKGLFCLLVGGLPVIKTYESMVVSATIMRGSSGSAVLNSNGEISGVVFAGNAEGLSYALVVPYEAVRNFLTKELRSKQLEGKLKPWEKTDGESGDEFSSRINEAAYEKIKKACSSNPINENLKELCRVFERDTLYIGE